MTITEHLNFSVLAAPLECLDRRALSQAWYSALFNAQGKNRASLPEPQRAVAPQCNAKRVQCAVGESSQGAARSARRTCAQGDGDALRPVAAERRAPTGMLATKIERALRRHSPKLPAAAFVLKGSSGRVQLLVQSRGSRLTLVALCRPSAKAEVARALSQARYALSLRGIQLDAHMREEAC